jgi:hypothetical protein
MSRFLSRIGGVASRMVTSFFHLHRTSRVLLFLGGLASAWVAAINWQQFKTWLTAEWTHAGVAIALAVLSASFVAMYGAEGELDALRVVRVSASAKTSLIPTLRMDSNRDEHDVFVYEVELRLRNDSDKIFRAYFPVLELYRKQGWRRWERVNLEKLRTYAGASVHLRGLPNEREHWYPEHRYEIAARDETIARFHQKEKSPDGASAFLGREYKLRLTIDIIGHPKKDVLEFVLPRVTDEYYR